MLLHSHGGDADDAGVLLVPLAGLPATDSRGWAVVTKAMPGAWLIDAGWKLQAALHAATSVDGGSQIAAALQAWWTLSGTHAHVAALACAVVHPIRKRVAAALDDGMVCSAKMMMGVFLAPASTKNTHQAPGSRLCRHLRTQRCLPCCSCRTWVQCKDTKPASRQHLQRSWLHAWSTEPRVTRSTQRRCWRPWLAAQRRFAAGMPVAVHVTQL